MTIKGIEVGGTIYNNEDETARENANQAAQTATEASQTATEASQTATEASQTATEASQTATEVQQELQTFTKVLYKDVVVTTTANTQVSPYSYFGNGSVSSIAGNFKILSFAPQGSSTDIIACQVSSIGSQYGSFYVYSMQPGSFTITVGYVEE